MSSKRQTIGKGAALTENLSSVVFVTDEKGRVTVAEVILNTPGITFMATGSSKRMNGDPKNMELGQLVALERAIENVRIHVKSKITELMD